MEEEEENWEVCDTELCLRPIGQRQSLNSSPSSALTSQRGKAPELQQQDEDGNITIFYNGRICACDVTEIQARAIISMAKKLEINNDNKGQVPCRSNTKASSSMAVVPSLLRSQSLSMKRSLQQFLQERKKRSLQVSSLPYQYHHSF